MCVQQGGAAPQRSIRVCGGEQHLVGGVVESDVHMLVRAWECGTVYEIMYAADQHRVGVEQKLSKTQSSRSVLYEAGEMSVGYDDIIMVYRPFYSL